MLFNFGHQKRREPNWMKKRVKNMQCLRAPKFLTRRNGEFAQAIAQNRLVFLSQIKHCWSVCYTRAFFQKQKAQYLKIKSK